MENPAPISPQDFEPAVADRHAGATPPRPGPLPPTRPDIVAITRYDELLLELRDAMPGKGRIRPADSAGAAVQLIRRNRRSHVLIIDTRELPDVRAAVQLTSTVPHAVVVLFAPAESQAQVIAAVSGFSVHAVLPLPVDGAATAAALESAFAEAATKQPAHITESPLAAAATGEADPAAVPPEPVPAGSGSLLVRVAAACVVLVLGAAAWWFLAHRHAPVAVQERIETSILNGRVDDLLEGGRRALREHRFTSPAGDNALLYYRSVLRVDPKNAEALDGMQRVAMAVSARLDRAMTTGHMDVAALALENLTLAAPGDPRLPALTRQIMAKWLASAGAADQIDQIDTLMQLAQRSGLATDGQISHWRTQLGRLRAAAGVRNLAALVTDRVRAGRLIEPGGDDARSYMQRLSAAAPGDQLTLDAQQLLNGAYLSKAREAATAHDSPEMERWLQLAQQGGASQADVDAARHAGGVQRPAAARMESDRLLGLFRDGLRDGRLTSPDQDSAAYYLGRAQAEDPGNPALDGARRQLVAKLLERAKGFISQEKAALADADLALARSLGADAGELVALQELAASHAAQSQSQSQSAASGSASSRSAPRLVLDVKPEFPEKALAAQLRGKVTVRFTVGVDGNTHDVMVVAASPANVFDRAAILAVKRMRFQPLVVDGKPQDAVVQREFVFDPPP